MLLGVGFEQKLFSLLQNFSYIFYFRISEICKKVLIGYKIRFNEDSGSCAAGASS